MCALYFLLLIVGVLCEQMVGQKSEIFGVRVESKDYGVVRTTDRQIHVVPDENVSLVVFGRFLNSNKSYYYLSTDIGCRDGRIDIKNVSATDSIVRVWTSFPKNKQGYYVCNGKLNASNNWSQIVADLETSGLYMPLYVGIPLALIFLGLSAVFSGLGLGVMALDPTELQVIGETGTVSERNDVRKITPLRKRSNFTLCSLLLGNTVANAALTLLLDNMSDAIKIAVLRNIFTIVVPTVLIVLVTEIIPQSICHKRGLRIGAKTKPLTMVTMAVTAVFSWPISKILDRILGEEGRCVYDRHRLLAVIELQKQHIGLSDASEMRMVSGVLRASHNKVRDVMTLLNDIFMVSTDERLSTRFVSEIIASGYTRIPVFEGNNRERVCSVLNVKDLALIDPDDNLRVGTICSFWQSSVRFALEDTPLKAVLKEMCRGDHHLTMVIGMNKKSSSLELVGLCTLEDVIEDIIQMEIMDETDRYTNNVERRRRGRNRNRIAPVGEETEPYVLSTQLRRAAAHFLIHNLAHVFDSVRPDMIERMLKQNTFKWLPTKTIYQTDKACQEFTLVLEGRLRVKIGDATYSAGPFHYFGAAALYKVLHGDQTQKETLSETHNQTDEDEFYPDYTVTIDQQETVLFRLTFEQFRKLVERSEMVTRIESINKDRIKSLMFSEVTQTKDNEDSKPTSLLE